MSESLPLMVPNSESKPKEPLKLPDGMRDDPPTFDGSNDRSGPLALPDGKQDSLADSYADTVHENSDKAAQILKISRETGQDPAVIEKDFDKIKPLAEGPSEEYLKRTEKEFPLTTKFLKDRANMVVSKDDIPNLTENESILNDLNKAYQKSKNAYTLGDLGEEAAFLNHELLTGRFSSPEHPRIAQINDRLKAIEKESQVLKVGQSSGFNIPSAAESVVEFIPQLLGQAKYSLTGGLGASIGPSLLSGPGAPLIGTTAFGLGALGGSAYYNYKLMAGQTYGALNAIRDDKGQPLYNEDQKKIIAHVVGAIGGGLGLVKLEALLKPLKGGAKAIGLIKDRFVNPATQTLDYKAIVKDFGKTWLESTAHGTAAMTGLAGVQITGEELAKRLSGQEFKEGEFKARSGSEIMKETAHAGVEAIKTMGMLGLPGALVGSGLKYHAANYKPMLERILDNAKKSKVIKRSPETVEAQIHELVKDTPLSNAYVPIEDFKAYYQTREENPEIAASELGVLDSYAEAEETGSSVEIPFEKLVSHPDLLKGLAEDIKFSPDEITEKEYTRDKEAIEKAKVDQQAEYDRIVKEAETEVETDLALKAFKDRVKTDIITKLKAVGLIDGMSEKEWLRAVEYNAELWSSVANTEAKRRGIPVEGLDAFADQVITSVVGENQALPIEMKTEILKRIQDEIQEGEHTPGGFVPLADSGQLPADVDANKFIPGTSTFPKYFKDKGLSKKSVLKALDKRLKGEALTFREEQILEDLYKTSGYDLEVQEKPFLQADHSIQTQIPLPLEVETAQLDPKVFGNGLFKTESKKQEKKPFQKLAFDFIKKAFQGKSFQNNHTGWKIDVSSKGLDEAKNHAVTPEHLISMGHLDKLIANSIYIESVDDIKKRKDIKKVHHFYGKVLIDGNAHIYKLIIRETKEGHKFYDHIITENRRSTGIMEGGSPEGQVRHSPYNGSPKTNIQSFLDEIKHERKTDPVFQADGKGQEIQGMYYPGKKAIRLTEKSDLSTFSHEMTHHWLTDIEKYVNSGEASPEYLKNYKLLTDWLEHKEGKISEAEQERVARAMELYLREGQSPTPALNKVFGAFRKWMRKLILEKDLESFETKHNSKLNDELRTYFDNLVASEDEISFAEQRIEFFKELDTSLLSPELQAKVHEMYQGIHDRAVSQQMKDQSPEEIAKRKEEAHKEAKAFVDGLPISKASEELSKRFKDLGLTDKELSEKYLKEINSGPGGDPEGLQFAMDYAETLHNINADPDLIAKEFAEGPTLADRIQALADQVFEAESNRAKTAEENTHGYKRVEFLALESQIFEELSTKKKRANREQYKITAEQAKQDARNILAGKTARQATAYLPYFTAERNAAVRSSKALAKGDLQAASKFKREQMLNHALAVEAIRNGKEYKAAQNRLKFFVNLGSKKIKIPFGHFNQIEELLVKYGLKDSNVDDYDVQKSIAQKMKIDGKDAEEIANLTSFVESKDGTWEKENLQDFENRQSENLIVMNLPSSVKEDKLKSFPDLKFSEVRDLRDTMNAIYKIGRNLDKFISFETKTTLKEASAEAAAVIKKGLGDRYGADMLMIPEGSPGMAASALKALSRLPDAALPVIKAETLALVLDGGDKNGPIHRYWYRPLSEALNKELVLSEKVINDIEAIRNKYFEKYEYARLVDESHEFPFLNGPISKDQILAMAFNQGNEGNKTKLLNGWDIKAEDGSLRKITQGEVDTILKTLSKKDWEYVQEILTYNDSEFWPEIQRLEMEVKGMKVKKVERSPIYTDHGVFPGGYYHIEYDPSKSNDAFRSQEQLNALYKTYSAASSQTNQGFTNSRVDNVRRPILLDTGVMLKHMQNVVHDLSYRRAVIDANRFLRQTEVKNAIINGIGPKGYRMMQEVISSVATDQRAQFTPGERMIQQMKRQFSMFTLGYRMFTFAPDYTINMVRALDEIGPYAMSRQFGDYATGGHGIKEFVHEKSVRMAQREKVGLQRDLKEYKRKLSDAKGPISAAWANYKAYAFWFQQVADDLVTVPTWKVIYENSLRDHDEKTAVHLADEAIERLFGSGHKLNQSWVERGGEWQKLFTTWYSWNGMMFNDAWKRGKIAELDYKSGNVPKAMKALAAASVFLVVVPGITEWLYRDYLFKNTSREQTDDQSVKELGMRIAKQGFGYLPFIGTAGDYIVDKVATGKADLSVPLIGQVKNILDPFADFASSAYTGKELSDHYAEEFARGLGSIAGTPKQLNTLIFNIIDAGMEVEPWTWKDILTRRTNKR